MARLRDFMSVVKPDDFPLSNYFIYQIFPFTVWHRVDFINPKKLKELTAIRIETGAMLQPFIKRLSAEQYRLYQLAKYYKEQDNLIEFEYWDERHNNIREEHPEWII